MAITQAKVIQRRSVTYADCGGKTVPVPCGEDVAGIGGEFWAVPVKDEGVFRGYKYVIAASAPTYDSFPVVKLYDKSNGHVFWVVGTLTEFLALCADGTESATTIPVVVPEICLCVEEGGEAEVRFTLPPLGANARYRMYLAVDGVLVHDGETNTNAFDAADDIATYLAANNASVGTWTNVGTDVVKLVATADKCVGLVLVPFTP